MYLVRQSRGHLYTWGGLLLYLLLVAGCEPIADDFPRDPQHSLEQILERGTLRVGVISNPPWIVDLDSVPAGPETQLLTDFAEQLGVDIEWHWGSEEESFEALKQYSLDVVAGGLKSSTPWRKEIGLTLSYYQNTAVVGTREKADQLNTLQGREVTVAPTSGLKRLLQDRDARVIESDNLASADGAIAAQMWEIRGMGWYANDIVLREQQQVLAVPSGENALLMRLERFLLANVNAEQLEAGLWQHRSRP
ncbi:transporter substrate-binding domain-containing protein [Halopseudomonas sp.]|jgi:polar amino acid transport system substrate-binding protein|uniref:transporter substrate-binding domain-containing protein n=1 Tax=Halopseudomonas sp. TaxID=2901191 RepID=UPI0039E59E78